MEPRCNAVFDPESSEKCENTVSTYDRADVLMGAGFSTFGSAALILVIPRVGIVLLELLLGLFFIGCAIAARVRLRLHGRSQSKAESRGPTNAKRKWFDRYDVLMILTVVVIYASISRVLRHAGLSEGTIGILPLILFAVGILLKPRIVQLKEGRTKTRSASHGERSLPVAPGEKDSERRETVERCQ